MNISVKLDSFNKIYKQGEAVTGVVEIDSKESISYEHITAVITGSYIIKNQKSSPPQTHIIKFYLKKQKIAENGKLKTDKINSFNMKIPLESTSDNTLMETYQGVVVTIAVSILYNNKNN